MSLRWQLKQQPQSKNAACSVLLTCFDHLLEMYLFHAFWEKVMNVNLHLLRALIYFFFFYSPNIPLVCMWFLKLSPFHRFSCDRFFCILCVLLTWKLPSADWTAAAWFLHLDLPLRERDNMSVFLTIFHKSQWKHTGEVGTTSNQNHAQR